MPFQLTIAEGKEAGREFVFEQPQVVIGRTSECDVVLYDPGVSRKHARIFSEGSAYFVEDMGSSNGTKVNGSVVKKQKLNPGDAVALGPVVFNFNSAAHDGTNPAGQAPGVADQSTRVFTMEQQAQRQLNKGQALAPEGANTDELRQIQRSDTRSMQALKVRMSNPGMPRVSSNPNAPVVRPASSPPARAAPSSPPVRSSGSSALSAAERARIRRESPGLLGSLKIFWAEASGAARGGIVAVLALLVLAGAGGVFYSVWYDDSKPRARPEPNQLQRQPIPESFGYGDGVTYERKDQKVFWFDFVSATKAVVMVHFQSVDISEGEVDVTVNGVSIGTLPPDTLNSNEVSHELKIPPEVLKKGERNEVIFDNVKNPPGSETWRIWNVWIESIPLPLESMEDLVRDSKTSYERATQFAERRDVGASNRYEAWRNFRAAWLLLEAHPAPRPELYDISRARMREAQQELDRLCSKLMLEAVTAYEHKQWNEARSTLEHVKDFFPNNDQPCQWRADQKRNELGL